MSWWEEYKKKNNIKAGQTTNSKKLAPVKNNINSTLQKAKYSDYNKNAVLKPGAFSDGYQLGDVTKTILGTTADVGAYAVKGIMNIGEGIGDLGTYGIAGVADLIGNDEYAEKLRYNASHMNVVDNITKPITDKTSKNSVLGVKSKNVVEGLGYVAGNTAMAIATGGIGTKLGLGAKGIKTVQTVGSMGTTFSSSMGNNMSEAYQNGATDDEAFAYGLISAAGETGSELLFGGLGKASKAIGLSKGAGALDDAVIGGLTKNIKNKMAKTLVQSGLKATGEGAEEVVSGFLNAVGKKATYMSEEELGKILEDENLAEQFWIGTLTSTIAQGPSTISSIKKGTDFITGESYENNGENTQEQQTILNNNKMVQNGNISETGTNNIELPFKELNYYESARKYNIDTQNESVQSIARLTKERGIKAKYDASVFTDTNQNAIWKVSKDNAGNISREVIINPNADTKKSLENIAIHELTHDLEGTEQYNQLKDIILQYDKTKSGYQEARQSLEKLYSKVYNRNSEEFQSLVDNEAVADILGSKLGDQEFINSLTTNNRTLGQRIYDWIIDKLNKLNSKLGYKSEKLYWTDVKNKFENAFKQDYQGISQGNSKYSIAGRKGMNNAIMQDTQNVVIEKSYNKALQMAKNNIDNETIRKTTNWFQDKNGDWKFEFSDKDMSLKNVKFKEGKTYKLGDILQHDTLFTIYPELSNYKVEVSKKFKANGAFDRKNNIIVINSNLTNNKKATEGTLIHEIQHAIQNLEGFEHGKSSRKSKLAYYNSLGEIEATDIKDRFISEKYNKKNISNIAPESSKLHPEHKNLNSYLKNRKLLDKVKDNVYNFNKKGGKKHEVPKEIISHDTTQDNSLVDGRKGRGYLSNQELEDSSSFSLSENSKWQDRLDKLYKNNNRSNKLQDIKIAPTIENKTIIPKNFAKINEELNNKSKDEKVAELLEHLTTDKMTIKEQKDYLAQKLVNKGHYIDQLAKITGNKELTYKYDRMLGAQSEGQYEVGVAQTDNNGKKIGKSINEIWKPVEENKQVAEFSDYLLHKHNIDRMKKGKPIFGEEITAEISNAMVANYEKLYPEFPEWAKDVYTFNKNQLKNTREAGLTSEEVETLLDDMYSSYVTVSRNKEKVNIDRKGKVAGPIAPIKKAVGGNADIQPLKDAMAKQAIAVKQAIRRNDLGLEIMKELRTAEDIENYDINNTLIQDNKGAYLLVFQDGKAKKVKITEGIYESLKPSQSYKIEKTIPLRMVQKASNLQRSLLTVDNPIFMITNFFKDFQDGMFNSKYSSKFIKNYGKALSEIKNKGEYYNEFMANGGNSNTYFDYEKGVKKDSKISKFLDKIRSGNEAIEMAPRLSEYISTREDGGSINEALYNAAEVTTNFKRGGDVAKALNRNGANFLNASIQGLSKQIRNLSGQNGVKGYTNLLVKATLLGVVPSVLNHLLLDDDEEYNDLPDYVKDTYFLFKIGEDKFLRIPKGRVLSIFGSAARRTLEYSEGDKEAFDGFKDTVLNQMAPNNPLSDNILAPVVQASKNETWYGGDLVPTRLQDEMPENQYDESTDSFSKWLGKLTGISPMKINYVIDQYSGGVGDIVLPMLTPQAENNVLTDKFTIDSVLKNKNVSKFYEVVEEQTKISNAPEATDEDLLKSKYLSSVQASVSDLYKEKREIQLSDLNDKEKKEEVKRIQKDINAILEKGLDKYDKGKIYDNYATIGNEEYYKNSKNEWVKLTEEDKEKNENISLKTYSDYKLKTQNMTTSKRASGELKETQSLSNKDKIQILLDSKYSSEEIKAIYENYIKNTNDKEYNIIDKTSIDIKEYLKYKQQDFSSDTIDDGTTEGKTVGGSSKVKTYEYVNKMNITYEQRLLILGMKYKLTTTERTKLYNYVKSLDYAQDEMQEVFESLKGFTVYKDGRVTW